MIRNAANSTHVRILLSGVYIQRTGQFQFDFDSERGRLAVVDGKLDNGVYLLKLDAPNTGTMALHAQYLERVEDEVQEAEHVN